ncbi:hypothetical protein [Brevundimonas sp.]|uniref:hypothetical protein n=1 Tax=Brevundimonas sp. TaxID=1871086 RepID=UPI001DDFC7C7|nr:hypothetical protein [Brevundimonas sp.]MBA3999850.1 hypothetical protein [Brevundimonas sp.]
MRLALIASMAALVALPAQARQDAAVGDENISLILPVVESARAAPDCGGLYGLAGRAQCMTAPLTEIGGLAELYVGALTQTGWRTAGGGPNQVLFERTRSSGGCDILEMITFYDVELSEEALATAPGYLGFALHTGGDCLPVPAEGETPPQ